MRLLKLGVYAPVYLENFYLKQPTLARESYEVQHRALIADCFGSADFWTGELRKLNYETVDIIANAESLQVQWANENNLRFKPENWLFEITAAQVEKFRPDVLLIADYSTFTAEFLRFLRTKCPSIKLILGWCGAPYLDLSVIREWDAALSCVPELVADFQSRGIKSYHINHAFAPQILEKLDLQVQPSEDFTFVGTIFKGSGFHIDREKLIVDLIKKTNLQLWINLISPSSGKKQAKLFSRAQAKSFLKTLRDAKFSRQIRQNLPLRQQTGAAINNFSFEIDELIVRRTHTPLFGIEMFQKLRDSRVVFNNHIDISIDSASNMRLFEATGTGACLLTDWKKNLPGMFEPDAEILTYRSAEECAEKVKYILEHEDERRKIAAAGQKRTLKFHNFADRAERLNEIIKELLQTA